MNQEIDCRGPAGDLRLRVESLPFGEIPNQSRLFLDYLSDPAALKDFYPAAVTDHSEIYERVPNVLRNCKTDRALLCDILLRQNSAVEASKKAIDNIGLLRDDDSVAVLTGQQAGMFLGPLYTIFKALSAIRMAECLKARGVKAVPVFWAATEDHDFDEISTVTVAGSNGQLSSPSSRPVSSAEQISVGKIVLGQAVGETVDELFRAFPQTEFSRALRFLVETFYRPNNTIGQAFLGLLARIFADYGLVVFDSLDTEARHLAKPIYLSATEKSDQIEAAVRERNRELATRGYHTQVAIPDGYFPLFRYDELGRRTAIRKTGDDSFRITDGGQTLSRAAIQLEIEADPARYSPGVLLRPLVQDYLFPTICYFGGAAEIAYSAQNSVVYEMLGRPATTIFHRQSFTIVESRFSRLLDRFDLRLIDLFKPFGELRSRLVADILDPDAIAAFARAKMAIDNELSGLDALVSPVDVTVAESLRRRRRKIEFHIDAVQKKFEAARLRRDETLYRQLLSLQANLMPNGNLQERSLNVLQFVDRYGEYFIDWVYRAIDLDDRGHRIVYL